MTVRTTCVTGFDANEIPTDIPGEDEFIKGDDYLDAPFLEEIATSLIAHYPEFSFLRDQYPVLCFWKKKARESGGKWIVGDAKKVSGLAKHLSQSTFVIEIAADKTAFRTNLEIEAMIYHELCHFGEETNDKGVSKPVMVTHDTELFRADVETYGLWKSDLTETNRMFRQLDLNAVRDAAATEAIEEFRESRAPKPVAAGVG